MCATGWPKSALTKNFSPIGPVVPEIWPNMWEKSQKKREKERVLKMTKKSRNIKIIRFLKSTNATSTQKNFMFAHGPVMYEDPKSAKILVLGDLVPEILSKNRF